MARERDGDQEIGEVSPGGTGKDLTIADLAHMIAKVVGFKGRLVFDSRFPDGTPRKLLEISRITRMGWQPRTPLQEGLTKTYAWFLESAWLQKALPKVNYP